MELPTTAAEVSAWLVNGGAIIFFIVWGIRWMLARNAKLEAQIQEKEDKEKSELREIVARAGSIPSLAEETSKMSAKLDKMEDDIAELRKTMADLAMSWAAQKSRDEERTKHMDAKLSEITAELSSHRVSATRRKK